MNPIWAGAIAAAAGIAGGSMLRGELVRLSVPSGEPEQQACGNCAARLPDRPAFRCPHCGAWAGAPIGFEAVMAAVVGLLIARFGTQPAVAAFGYLGIVGVALTQIDIGVQRLPDRLTLPAYPALLILLALAAMIGQDWSAFARAVLGGLVAVAGYLLLSVASRGQLGGGDIKLAGLIGLVLGWLSWHTLAAGVVASFLLAAVASAVLLATRRISRTSKITFGPYLLGGAFIAMLASTATASR
ncbi:MAG TPA: A24 family peptidase [Streptosporangiaceae bacterium]|nr:A24 family peptidase [Streptosporangiaceae bacterium]